MGDKIFFENGLEQLVVLEEKDISDKLLFNIFNGNTRRIVYIVENRENSRKLLVGIITAGNFRRNKLGNYPLINRNCTKILKSNKDTAERIFFEHKDKDIIAAVPIVDNEGYLEGEICKKVIFNNHKNLDLIKRTYIELKKLSHYKTIILILDKNANELDFIEEDSKIKIVNEISLEGLMEYAQSESLFVCDCEKEKYRIREIFYEEFNIPHTLCDITETEEEIQKIVFSKAKFYQRIGVWKDECSRFDNIINDKSFSVIGLDYEKCYWDENRKIYVYDDDIETPECIFMDISLSEKPYFCINGKYVPVVSIAYRNPKISTCDIAFNILPMFEQYGIKYMIFRSPDDEYGKVKEYFSGNIKGKGYYWRQRKNYPEFITGGDVNDDNIEEIEGLFNGLSRYAKTNGFTQQADITSRYVNIVDGERYTCGNPETYERTAFFFGPCLVQGNFVSDGYTMTSYMRKNISNDFYLKNCGDNWNDMNYKMRNQIYHLGDIVILLVDEIEPFRIAGYKVNSIINVYRSIPSVEKHVWNSLLHVNKIAMKYIAEEVYSQCKEQKLFEPISYSDNDNRTLIFGVKNKKNEIPEELKKWIDYAKKYSISTKGEIGSIVMNCNPFTKGHRYLIERASEQVKVLYVFVVEKDRSFFKFKDRLKMVEIGTADLKNVIVIPSGRYIISTETLPGYFEKEEKPFLQFDATQDLKIFSDIIAKEFNITVRFAGEEPIDAFTNHYNEAMKKFLPVHGIRFVEVPRKKINGDVISATKVRRCIVEKKYDELKDLVLPEIYDYLKKQEYIIG